MTYDAIERSLQTDVWDAEQMRGICDKLAIPNDVEQHWRASLEAEKLLGLAALQSNQLGNGPVADGATQNSLLLMYEQAVEISPQPLSSFVQRVGDFENEIVENSFSPIISQVMPALASYAQAWVTFEDSRKFLRLACAIKLYQLQEGKWPTKFSELEAVGLSADDWDLAGSELADIKVAEGAVSIEAISERAAATYFPLPNVGQSDSQVSRITIR